MSEGSYRIWKLKENMINHLLLLFFVINLFISLFGADEVSTLPLETSRPLGSYIQPDLPKLNIKYNPISPRLPNFEKDGSTYCPHIEILTRILNEVRNFLPQGSGKVKDVLSNYYTILDNALNNKYSVEPLNKFSSEDRTHYIDSLAQKLTMMDDKNAKIKISFEYELPTVHKTVCEKLCDDLINYANAENLLANSDLNYANEQGKMKNNIMTLLQNYRPDNINPNSSSYIKLKKDFLIMNKPDYVYYPNSDDLLSNPVSPNVPILNPLPSISEPLSNQTGTSLYGLLQNFAPVHQVPTDTGLNHLQSLAQLVGTSFNPLQILSTPLPNSNGNINSFHNAAHSFNPLGIITPLLPNPKGNINSLHNAAHSFNPLEIIAPPLPNTKGKINSLPNGAHTFNPMEIIATPLPNQKGTINSLQNVAHSFNPLEIIAPTQPIPKGIINSLPNPAHTFNPLEIIAPPLPNTKGKINSLPNGAHTFNPMEIIATPLPNQKGTINFLQNAAHSFNPLEIIAPTQPIPKGIIDSLPNPEHTFNPLEIIAPPLPNTKGNINSLSKGAHTFNPLEIIALPLPNQKGIINSLPNAAHAFNPLEIIAPPLPNTKGNINSLLNGAHTFNPLEIISPPLPNPKGNVNSLPNAAFIFNPLEIITTPLPNLKGNINSLHNAAHTLNPLQIIASPLPDPKGNINSLQNMAYLPQNPIGPQYSSPIESLPLQIPKLTENAKDFEKLAKPNYHNFDSNKNSQYIHNNKLDAVQPTSKNNPTSITPTKFENRWSQSNYVSTNNQYSNNEKLLQEKLIQSYNQQKPTAPNVLLGANEHNPANLYHDLNTNDLSSIKQYEIKKSEKDSTSAQANLDKQYLQLVKNFIYLQTNPGTGYLLNPQVPPPSNVYPFSFEKNNALYNSYVKNINQLATPYNIPNGLAFYPKSYYDNSNLGVSNTAKDTQESYDVQFEDLNRLLGVSNLDKLNFVSGKNGIIELTYKLNNSQPSAEPFFYLKYRLPYNLFLFNLKKLLFEKPNLRNDLQLLYKNLLIASNITSSSVSKSVDKDELLNLVSTNGTLVAAKVLKAKDTTAKEQIKIVQRLNANMPLEEIVKTDAHITKASDLTSNIPLINYLRDRLNYLNGLQRKIAVKPYYLNPYNTQTNQNYYQYVQYPTYLGIRKPTLEYNYLRNQQSYPYYQYGLNPFSRYYGFRW